MIEWRSKSIDVNKMIHLLRIASKISLLNNLFCQFEFIVEYLIASWFTKPIKYKNISAFLRIYKLVNFSANIVKSKLVPHLQVYFQIFQRIVWTARKNWSIGIWWVEWTLTGSKRFLWNIVSIIVWCKPWNV